ncbi:hypothetical protein BDR07DRAFT_1400589 [Suillus spraguei]|nr:hypothetical protein BDR07DRAFT_1400589 [Suillus spraguei]
MSNSESSLIHTTGHYGSTQSTSGTSQNDGAIGRRSNVPGFVPNNAGMLYIISSHLSVKMLSTLEPPVHAFEGITLICCVTYIIAAGVPDPIIGPKGVRILLVIHGISGFLGLAGLYLSIQYLADATRATLLLKLSQSYGLTSLVYGYLVEASLVCSLFGAVLIARPPFLFNSIPAAIPDGFYLLETTPAQRMMGHVCTTDLLMVMATSIVFTDTSIRAIGKRAHPMHVMTFFSLWCTIMASLGLVNISLHICVSWKWSLLLLMVGIFGFVAQTLLTLGLQREAVSRVIPSLLSVLGAAIIMSSALCVALTRRQPTPNSTTDSTA